MKQGTDEKRYRQILIEKLPKKIDSVFIERYFGGLSQVKLGLGTADEFEDALLMNGLAGLDCAKLGLDFSELSQEEFEHLPFDSKTVFSEETKAKFHPEKVLEKRKEFGLGLEKLPISGEGAHVAIRDQNCDPYLTDADVVEYTRVKHGEVSKKVNQEDEEHMHGLTTTSLLASKSCGVAKGAKVHFFNGSIDEYIEHVVSYNKKCISEKRFDDMILVAAGSWRDRDFEKHRDMLREVRM